MADDLTLKEIQNIAAIRELKKKQEKEALKKAYEFVAEKGLSGQHGTPNDVMKQLLDASYAKKIKGESLSPKVEAALKKFAETLPEEEVSAIKNKYAKIASDMGVDEVKAVKNFFPAKGALVEEPVKAGMRASTLGAKLGKGVMKGLKSIPAIGTMLGLGTALATGDVNAAIPVYAEMGKLGEGSDVVPMDGFISKEELKKLREAQKLEQQRRDDQEDDTEGVKRPSLNKLRAILDSNIE